MKESTEVLHVSTAIMADNLNTVLKAKLLKAQIKYGLTRGWEFPPEGVDCTDGRFFMTEEQCNIALKNHLAKGDIVDCVAYLGFMLAKGWKLDIL